MEEIMKRQRQARKDAFEMKQSRRTSRILAQQAKGWIIFNFLFFSEIFIPSKERMLRKEAQKEADWETLLEEKRSSLDKSKNEDNLLDNKTKEKPKPKPDLDDLLDL